MKGVFKPWAGAAALVILSGFPLPVLPLTLSRTLSDYTQGKFAFYGALSLETEKYDYSREAETESRRRLREKLELNGRGFIWDPRLATFDGGVTLQNENIQATEGATTFHTLGYRLNTVWLAERPYPLTIFTNRYRSTVADYLTPAYDITTTNLGARWGMDAKWLGQTRLYYDRTRTESDNIKVLRSDLIDSYGVEAQQKIRPKQWGESDFNYGYRRNTWDDRAYGSFQRQNYFYLFDRSLFGDKANMSANVTYFNRDDQWGLGSSIGNQVTSNFLAANSAFSVQQTDKLRHYYNVGLSVNGVGETQTNSYNLMAGFNYRFDEHWQANGSLGENSSKSTATTTSNSSTSCPPESGTMGCATTGTTTLKNNATLANAGVLYNSMWGSYFVSGGYNLSVEWPNRSTGINTTGVTHAVNVGYARRASPLFVDTLDLRLSTRMGELEGNEQNIRYGVNSQISASDMLQGLVEYRHFTQSSTVLADIATPYDYLRRYQESSSGRIDVGWMHRISQAGSFNLSTGMTKSRSYNQSMADEIVLDSAYVQGRVNAMLRSNLQWTALVREERIQGPVSQSGRRLTAESDLVYRIGKWQASARYRLRDARLETAPFKERSLMFYLKRDFGITF